jgi:hypothetical protein
MKYCREAWHVFCGTLCMNNRSVNYCALLSAAVICLNLSACGGGGDDDEAGGPLSASTEAATHSADEAKGDRKRALPPRSSAGPRVNR